MRYMYNKLFTKILDSTIWLQPDAHRLVWITLIAAMDEDSNAMIASVENLSLRARVTLNACKKAVEAFESPDPYGSEQDYEGRRIERIPGGWHIINGPKYRAIVTKAIAREKTRERVARHRAKLGNAFVTPANAPLRSVTPSEAIAEAAAETPKTSVEPKRSTAVPEGIARVFEHWKTMHQHSQAKLDDKRQRLIAKALKAYSEADLCLCITGYLNSPHHMGQNDSATRYDAIELLLRDSQHIDAGLQFYKSPPVTHLSKKTRDIVSQTEGWTPPEARRAPD